MYNILVIEDSPYDFLLVKNHLQKKGMIRQCVQVSCADELLCQLKIETWDLVLCDYKVPGLDIHKSLEIVHEACDSPILIFSGTVGEERAVEMLKLGFADFILKSNLVRLIPAIHRAVQENHARRAKEAADEKIREQAELLDLANDAILVRSLDNKILYWNRAAERQYGWKAEEVVGHHVMDILYSESRVSFEDALAEVMQHGDFHGRIVHRRKDGVKLTVDSHWILVRDKKGQPKSLLAIHSDLTDQISLEERLFQAQKLEALGQLTGGIAHDFNNLLTVMLGNADLLEEELAARPDLSELATMICEAGEKGATLINRLLAFARRQQLEPTIFDPVQLVDDMKPLIVRSLGESIEVQIFAEEGERWPVNADEAQFEAAILNLLINARDAMPDGGKVSINVKNVKLDSAYAKFNPELRPGPYVLVEVVDTGVGMVPEVVSKVLDPFFTTKGMGEHSGLGLSMVYGFIMQSNGHLKIHTKPGSGTTVQIFFPKSLANFMEDDVTEIHSKTHCMQGSEHILFVEDDMMVRRHGKNILTSLGYQVTCAKDGKEAMMLLKTGIQFDLLFTDVVMPGKLNGPQLAIAAKNLRPGLPVLFTSGYTEEDSDFVGMNDDSSFLRKPYDRESLALRIRGMLDTRPKEKSHV